MQKNSMSAKIYFPFLVIIVLLTTECVLRFLLGYPPGVFRKIEGFRKVDKLISKKNFTTDATGIYKFSSWVSDSLSKYYDGRNIQNSLVREALYTNDDLDDLKNIFTSYRLITNRDFTEHHSFGIGNFFKNNIDPSYTFNKFSTILKTPLTSNDEWHIAIINYLKNPFNNEGFRSIEFKKHKSKRKRILIVGDSFVYGMTAKPYFNSFYDILLAKGYLVYGAGIPGTDPAQYAAIINKYVPELCPDLVIVCFYPGNDLMQFPRTPNHNMPYEHITNAGFFNSYINGKYYNETDAYKYYLSLITIPQNGLFLNTALSKTSITTMIWGGLRKLKFTHHPIQDISSPFPEKSVDDQIKITKLYIENIISTCSNNKTPLAFAVIPDEFCKTHSSSHFLMCDSSTMNSLFNKQYYFPDSFMFNKHYPKDDYHFNNQGHLLFASFLDKVIIKGNSNSN